MKLVTFHIAAGDRVGYIEQDQVVDLTSALPMGVSDMLGLIRMISSSSKRLGPALQQLLNSSSGAPRMRLQDVRLLAPIPRPAKNIYCVGKNYREHAEEFHSSGFDSSGGTEAIPEYPIFFSKPPTSVIGPGEPIPAELDPTNSVDYENELAIIIGRGGRGIAKAEAFDHVFGYTIVNDVTSRTLQRVHKQWLLGKGIDGFCPMGPSILTSDSVADVRDLTLTTYVNGEQRQHAQVRSLIFDIPTLIETISRSITLEPGDIIATGTPAGVGIGFTPPRFLRVGDVVVATIDAIGSLSNPVGTYSLRDPFAFAAG